MDITVESNINQVIRQWGQATKQLPQWVRDGINNTRKDIIADLERSVSTWEHNVDFNVAITRSGKTVTTSIGTDDEIFGYVNSGTGLWGPRASKYPIVPRRPGYPLRFQAGYKAKTIPGRIWAQPGGAFGEWVHTMRVMHPGIKPRRILETVMRKHEVSLLRYINLAIGAGLSKAVATIRMRRG